MDETLCPCGSKKKYNDCCEPIIKGTAKASTAEALMRSRYSAYVKHEIEYIADSCVREAEDNEIDIDETRKWSEVSTWHGLKIIRTEKGQENDTEGVVEFTADYTRKGIRDIHHETANFKKINNTWVYSNGYLKTETVVRDGRKIGRNEKCPCGSGKKYKQCCGR